ncbi:MAG: hypothetical protein NC033_00550 [Clostridiales bacterium]|nr:hypothetical protein [Clostridiales bacterium]
MSYDIVKEENQPCPCGKGFVNYILEENDWGQFRENVFIQCDNCQTKYTVQSKYFCPKPKHDYTLYFLVKNGQSIDSPETIKLDF